MKTELFIELVYKAKEMSSMFTLSDIVNEECGELDVRGVAHPVILHLSQILRAIMRPIWR